MPIYVCCEYQAIPAILSKVMNVFSYLSESETNSNAHAHWHFFVHHSLGTDITYTCCNNELIHLFL